MHRASSRLVKSSILWWTSSRRSVLDLRVGGLGAMVGFVGDMLDLGRWEVDFMMSRGEVMGLIRALFIAISSAGIL